MTDLEFRKGGMIHSRKQTNMFEDPTNGFRNLIECIFHKKSQEHLVDLAINLLNYIKEHGGIQTTDFWKGDFDSEKKIGELTYSYTQFQTILRHLRNAGMVYGKKKAEFRLSRNFVTFLTYASECWEKFLSI